MGGARAAQNDPIFVKFREGEQVEVHVRAVVFVPGSLVCAVTFQEQEVKNAIPHITVLLKGRASAKQSNDVLERVFADAEMRQRYR